VHEIREEYNIRLSIITACNNNNNILLYCKKKIFFRKSITAADNSSMTRSRFPHRVVYIIQLLLLALIQEQRTVTIFIKIYNNITMYDFNSLNVLRNFNLQ